MTPDPTDRGHRAKIVRWPSSDVTSGLQEQLLIAAELITRLNQGRIRYGVYKNRRCVRSGLAGLKDLDLLVATADVARFETVLHSLKAVRGKPHPLHDNVVAGRSQWFVLDFSSGDYLHLDVAAGLRIGHRFAKRYSALDYDDMLEWEVAGAP